MYYLKVLWVMHETLSQIIGGSGMNNLKLKPKRIIDTFPARDLKCLDGQNPLDSLSEYSSRRGYGLELRRRRKHHGPIVL